ncbi:hypothetical protein PRUB_b0681 [Pseudoalteromonas rubra]|uniref:Uncharacterized protein n=1 Tax=Pseudoalteromonas rubra TaxID=43658 RepID=A0A8T0C2I2_9GAMM|nr:hypothetical protein PRUB_b0681 [Pseudoalteromonas rubra]
MGIKVMMSPTIMGAYACLKSLAITSAEVSIEAHKTNDRMDILKQA